jgi:hypothetical protein
MGLEPVKHPLTPNRKDFIPTLHSKKTQTNLDQNTSRNLVENNSFHIHFAHNCAQLLKYSHNQASFLIGYIGETESFMYYIEHKKSSPNKRKNTHPSG